jgi:hypothetical protein
LVEERLVAAEPGTTIRLKEEFGVTSEYSLVFDLREDDFDPSSADPELKSNAR